jgi:hypothetical protein
MTTTEISNVGDALRLFQGEMTGYTLVVIETSDPANRMKLCNISLMEIGGCSSRLIDVKLEMSESGDQSL